MDWQSWIEYCSFRAAVFLLRVVSARRAEALLAHIGQWTGSVAGVRRRVVEEQLKMVFPELDPAARSQLVRGIYRHLGRTVAEIFGRDWESLCAGVRVEPGWEPIDEALAEGRGAIVVTGHIGNFELGGAVIAARHPLLDVVKTQRNIPFDRYLERMRRRRGITTVPMEAAAPAVLRQLRRGGLVSLLVDQDAGAAGVPVPFLGQMASTWTGAARFSIRTGCPIVPLAIVREGPGRHVLRIRPVLEPAGLVDRPQDVAWYTQRISAEVEILIKENPEQWFWVHRRWKGAGAARLVPIEAEG